MTQNHVAQVSAIGGVDATVKFSVGFNCGLPHAVGKAEVLFGQPRFARVGSTQHFLRGQQCDARVGLQERLSRPI